MNVFRDAIHIWWAKPSIRTDENEDIERKATWLELFYDLAFVGILAQLSHLLFKHPSWEIVGQFTFQFVAAWWIWNSATFYNERYERNEIRHRVLTFISMIPLVGIAWAIHSGLDKSANVFAVSYIASRIFLIYMWMTAGSSKIERKLSIQFSIGFSISVVLWCISLFIPGPSKYLLWAAGLIVDMITPMITLNTQAKMPKISTHHIPERFGLFTILTIGETVIGAINGFASNHHIDLWIGATCVLGLIVSFLIWWLYIDQVLYRVFRKNVWAILAWAYLHLPLAIGITAVGAAILALVTNSGSEVIDGSIRWLLCGSMAFTIFIVSLINFVSENEGHQEKVIKFHKKHNNSLFAFKILSIVLLVLLGFIGKNLHGVALLSSVIGILLIPILNGIYIWLKSHLEVQKQSIKSV